MGRPRRVLAGLALLSAWVAPGNGVAMEFSISSSATDPLVNSSQPTGQLRNLYLWAVCVDDGISALQLEATGATPLAFTSMNGVLNAGTAGELLLAIPACPYGNPLNVVLGSWIVEDTGVSLCVASGEDAIAVGCGQAPVSMTDVTVHGFSSTGAGPCTVGGTTCEGAPGGPGGMFGTN